MTFLLIIGIAEAAAITYLLLRKRYRYALVCALVFVSEAPNLRATLDLSGINYTRYMVISLFGVYYLFTKQLKRQPFLPLYKALPLLAWLFVTWVTISSIEGRYQQDAITRSLSFIGLAIFAIHLLRWRTIADLTALVAGLGVSSSVLVWLSIVLLPFDGEQIHGTGRYQGLFVNPNNLAALCVGSVLSNVFFATILGRGPFKVLSAASLIVSAIALVFSGSRAGMGVVIVAVAVLLLYSWSRKIYRARRWLFLVPAFLASAVIVHSTILSDQTQPFTGFFLREDNFASYRDQFFINATAIIRENPLFGLGLGSTRGLWSQDELDSEKVHQLGYMTTAVEVGLPGMASLFGLIGATIMLYWKRFKHECQCGNSYQAALLFAVLMIYSAFAGLGVTEDYPVSAGASVTVIMWIISGAIAWVPIAKTRVVGNRQTAKLGLA